MGERCKCGAFLTELDDYAAEGYVEGSYLECRNPQHKRMEPDRG